MNISQGYSSTQQWTSRASYHRRSLFHAEEGFNPVWYSGLTKATCSGETALLSRSSLAVHKRSGFRRASRRCNLVVSRKVLFYHRCHSPFAVTFCQSTLAHESRFMLHYE
ncbi:hypothetical protein Zmor_019109 [Zophobas morio]|uniref:Uncharacterized protein n=1 Tax=Zophobas morio TaxID=2755281 RepID=A0AA38HNV7_9CUCU|nr:hypothetical protein Zmor_019109 [Zophobas morio]